MRPTRTPSATTGLRRRSMAAARARSASFSSHTSISRNCRLVRNRSTSICLDHKPTSTTTTANTTLILTRPRSNWLSHPRPNTIFGFRLSSTFHDPRCKWIRSSEGPHATPRDKECPACQEAEKQPEQLSPQELWWERRMHRFREAVDRDPYDAMFGWSNDMLKGRPLRARWFWDDVREENGRAMWTLRAIREEAAKNHERWRLQMASRGREAEEKAVNSAPRSSVDPQPQNKKVKIEASKSEDVPVKKSQPQPEIQAYSKRSWKSTDSTGKYVERSGTSMYDPVSGRMVPVEQKVPPEEAMSKSLPPKTASENFAKKTETISETARIEIKEKTEFIKWLSEHPEELEEFTKAKQSPDYIVKPAQHTEKSGSTQSPVPAEADKATSRDQLYKKTERSLVVAQESIRALIATDPARHQLAVRAEDRAQALRATPLGKTLLCLRNTRLSLESYSASVKALARLEHGSTNEDEATSELIHKKHKLEWSWRRDEKRPASARDPHFKQRETKYPLKDCAADAAARQAYESLHRHRHAPLKYMNSHELQNHRYLLLRSWKKQHPESQPSQTAAQKRLSQEVEAQKNMYAAWENRWSRKTHSPSSTSAPAPAPRSPANATQSASDQAPQQAAPVIAAEGDMCPNVAKFCNAERVYKRKAPHAMMDDEPTLVQNIKNIYEETYGTIDASHRQRKVDQEMFDTTRSSLWRDSTTSSTHDRNAPARPAHRPAATTHPVSPLITSLQRHRASRKASQDASSSASGSTPTSEVDSRSISRPAPYSSPYLVVEYNESKLTSNTRPVASHPDGWSSPRSSPNTIMENLRSKTGYSSVLLPQIQKLREVGYVLWDLARDDRSIIFKLRDQQPDLAQMGLKTAKATPPVASSTTTSKVNSASPRFPNNQTTNPVDPALCSPPQTQTGNFASPTGFVNLDRPNEPVTAPRSDGPADKTPMTMFEMLDAHASQVIEQTPEKTRQQRKELHQILRHQQPEQREQREQREQPEQPEQQEPDVPPAEWVKIKRKMKRQERVYSGRRQKGPGGELIENATDMIKTAVMFVGGIVLASALVVGIVAVITWKYPPATPSEIDKLKVAARSVTAKKAGVEFSELREKQREAQARYDAELALIQNIDAGPKKTAQEANTEPKTTRENEHAEPDAEPQFGYTAKQIQAWLNQKIIEAEAELTQVQTASAARRKASAEARSGAGMSCAESKARAASMLWQDEKVSPTEAQTRGSMQQGDLNHPVAVAFVEAATLSLSLGAVGWIFLKMLGQ